MIKFPLLSVLTRLVVSGLLLATVVACACEDCAETPFNGASYIQMASVAPPPPILEDVPISYSPRTEVWRPGYWDYSGLDYTWVAGEFIDRPAPTATWSPDHWIRHTYGWAFVPGYWQ